MPNWSAGEILNRCRDIVAQESDERRSEQLKVFLMAAFPDAVELFSSLDFSTLMADLTSQASDSVFYLRPDASPDEALCIRLLIQIVRQRSYDVLTEIDVRALEERYQQALSEDRRLRIRDRLNDIERELNGMRETLIEKNFFSNHAIEISCEQVGRVLDQTQKSFASHPLENIPEFVTPLRDEFALFRSFSETTCFEARVNGVAQAIEEIRYICSEHQLADLRPNIEALSQKQANSTKFLSFLFRQIPALNRIHPRFWDPRENLLHPARLAGFLYALSLDESVEPRRTEEELGVRPYQNVIDVAFIQTEYQEIAFKSRLIELMHGNQLRGFRKIKGDGNCYYRAVIIGTLEQFVLCQGDERRERFSYLAEQINQLLQVVPFQGTERNRILEVIDVLQRAAQGQALHDVRELEQFLLKYDLTWVRIMRHALALMVRHNLTTEVNNLTIEDAIHAPYDGMNQTGGNTVEWYLREIVLKMGTSAEGAPVDACLLNIFLGVNIHTCILTRDRGKSATVSSNPLSTVSVGGYAPKKVYLNFRPGHYDLFETVQTYDALKAAERAARPAVAPSAAARPAVVLSAAARPAVVPSAAARPAVEETERSVENAGMKSVMKKQNYTFMMSVFSANTVSVLLLLAGLTLMGVASFGMMPLIVGLPLGAVSLVASIGLFAANRPPVRQSRASEVSLLHYN